MAKGIQINKKSGKIDQSKYNEVKSTFSKKDETVTVEKISNGFVATRNYQEGEGMKREYKTEKIYYPQNPL